MCSASAPAPWHPVMSSTAGDRLLTDESSAGTLRHRSITGTTTRRPAQTGADGPDLPEVQSGSQFWRPDPSGDELLVDQPVISRKALRHALVARAGLVLCCLVLTSCGGQGEGPSTSVTVVPTPTLVVAPTELGAVVWSRKIDPVTSEPVERREAFSRDEKDMYAVIETGPLAAGTRLTATWAFNSQPIEGVEVELTADVARSAGWVAFHLEWNGTGLWPAGTLAVEITASTGESTRSSVEIQGT